MKRLLLLLVLGGLVVGATGCHKKSDAGKPVKTEKTEKKAKKPRKQKTQKAAPKETAQHELVLLH